MAYDKDLVQHHKQEALRWLQKADELGQLSGANLGVTSSALLAIAHTLLADREEQDVMSQSLSSIDAAVANHWG